MERAPIRALFSLFEMRARLSSTSSSTKQFRFQTLKDSKKKEPEHSHVSNASRTARRKRGSSRSRSFACSRRRSKGRALPQEHGLERREHVVVEFSLSLFLLSFSFFDFSECDEREQRTIFFFFRQSKTREEKETKFESFPLCLSLFISASALFSPHRPLISRSSGAMKGAAQSPCFGGN